MKLSSAFLARTLALVWAGFWMFFFVAESWAWHTPLLSALPWIGLGVTFIILALAACRWETAGGLLLVAAGFSTAVAYAFWAPLSLTIAVRVLGSCVFGVPALVAGVLFLTHRQAGTERLQSRY